MGSYINDCGKHIYLWNDGKWIDITEAMDRYVKELVDEHIEERDKYASIEDVNDDEITFCDVCCDDCPETDQLDDYDIVDEDDYDFPYEPDFWGIPDVRRIVFNDPATIVFWEDNTKTVVKCMKGEKFERYAGFAMACMKKMFGSTSRAKAIMEECDAENMKHWQEEALKPKAQSETKPESKVNKYEPKYKPLDYGPFIETLEKFMHTFDNMEDRMKEEKKDGTSEA